MNDFEIGYCTGIFDGEGSAMLIHFKGKPMIKIHISNTDQRVVEWLAQRFPKCSVNKYQPKGITKGGEPYKPIWQFQISGKTAKQFFEIILPQSIIKKEKIEKLLSEVKA